MKKILLAIAMVSIVSFAAADLYAWERGRGWHMGPRYHQGYGPGFGHHGFGYLEFMKEEIGLTDQQIEKIMTIDSEYRLKYFKNRGNYDKFEALRIEHRKAVDNVLTESQKKKLSDYNRNWNRRGYEGYGHCNWW
jgi:Spy/CpxP family protein refolding chaperone